MVSRCLVDPEEDGGVANKALLSGWSWLLLEEEYLRKRGRGKMVGGWGGDGRFPSLGGEG